MGSDKLIGHDGKPYRYKEKKAGQRRSAPIHAYIGANGSGKSLAAVHDTLPSLHSGRRVLSTVKILDPSTGEPHPLYERLTDWSQLLEASHCDVIFDEVLGIASSRSSQGMPTQVTVLLNQLRRRDITLRWTAPAWSRADVVIRECTQSVTVCRGFLSAAARNVPGEEQVRQWRPKRLFHWSTYNALDFSTWSDSKEGKLEREVSTWFWGPSSEAFRSYNTLDSVERVGEVLDSGTCAYCGGHRARPKCSCGDEAHPGRHSASLELLPSVLEEERRPVLFAGRSGGTLEGEAVG